MLKKMRIDRFISQVLGLSRNDARQEIKKGIVKVNNKQIMKNDVIINPINDTVCYRDNILKYQEFIYIMLNKPKDYLSATIDQKHKTVMDLLPDEIRKYKPSIIGRLDIDTEGLILITNDGKLSHKITSPSSNIYKKYYVEVKGSFISEDIQKFQSGIAINDAGTNYITKPAILEIIDKSSAYISISEGKYHQIKKMCLATDKEVVYLRRIEVKGIKIDSDLNLGEFRHLNEEEVKLLKL